jgi:delta14-sterol reductase
MGFKLTFGCLAFYPYFYAIGLWAVADRPSPGTPVLLLVVYSAVFLTGWSLARGANMQKFVFKTDPGRTFLGVFEPRTVSDGSRALLCSGFWGVSRHVNYLGEILMATGLTLALGYPLVGVAWLYPLYYVALLFTRERDDDKRCRAKYGALWDEYVEQVPRRIIPGIY